jgi:hypothetical protein
VCPAILLQSLRIDVLKKRSNSSYFLLCHLTVLSILVELHAYRHNVMSQKARVFAVVGASDFKIEAASIEVCRVGGDE